MKIFKNFYKLNFQILNIELTSRFPIHLLFVDYLYESVSKLYMWMNKIRKTNNYHSKRLSKTTELPLH